MKSWLMTLTKSLQQLHEMLLDARQVGFEPQPCHFLRHRPARSLASPEPWGPHLTSRVMLLL